MVDYGRQRFTAQTKTQDYGTGQKIYYIGDEVILYSNIHMMTTAEKLAEDLDTSVTFYEADSIHYKVSEWNALHDKQVEDNKQDIYDIVDELADLE